MTNDQDAANDARNANARERMEALKARRANDQGAATTSAPAVAGRRGGGAGMGKSGMGNGGGRLARQGLGAAGEVRAVPKGAGRLKAMLTDPDQAQQRQALQRVVKLLADTPDDGTGLVEGTNFSKAGVRKLMDQLEGRAAGEKGKKGATMMLRLLTSAGKAEGAGSEMVHGAQVSRLRQLAKMRDALKARGK